jgi:hypothetical protein
MRINEVQPEDVEAAAAGKSFPRFMTAIGQKYEVLSRVPNPREVKVVEHPSVQDGKIYLFEED